MSEYTLVMIRKLLVPEIVLVVRDDTLVKTIATNTTAPCILMGTFQTSKLFIYPWNCRNNCKSLVRKLLRNQQQTLSIKKQNFSILSFTSYIVQERQWVIKTVSESWYLWSENLNTAHYEHKKMTFWNISHKQTRTWFHIKRRNVLVSNWLSYI